MSGALPGDQEHVVIIKIDGPKTNEEYEAFRQELEAVLARHQGSVVKKARTKKSPTTTK